MLQDWIGMIGADVLREREGHTMIYDTELSEEAVGALCEPLSDVLAQFGLKLPSIGKWRAA